MKVREEAIKPQMDGLTWVGARDTSAMNFEAANSYFNFHIS